MVVMLMFLMVMVMMLMFLMVMVMMLMFLMVMVMFMRFMIVVMLMVMVVLMLLHLRQQLIRQRDRLLHRIMDRPSAQLIPGRGDDRRIRVLRPDHENRIVDLLLRSVLRPREDDRSGAFNLVVIEFSEVFHIHPDFFHIGNGHKRTDLQITFLRSVFDRTADIRELSDA